MTPIIAMFHHWAAVPFRWGETDCVLICADWVKQVRGVDPASDLRLAYGSAGECQRLTGFFTDPLSVIAPRMEAAGLAATDSPARGDVGLVLIQTERGARPHGAVCIAPDLWGVKSEQGFVALRPLQIIGAWSVGYEDSP